MTDRGKSIEKKEKSKVKKKRTVGGRERCRNTGGKKDGEYQGATSGRERERERERERGRERQTEREREKCAPPTSSNRDWLAPISRLFFLLSRIFAGAHV